MCGPYHECDRKGATCISLLIHIQHAYILLAGDTVKGSKVVRLAYNLCHVAVTATKGTRGLLSHVSTGACDQMTSSFSSPEHMKKILQASMGRCAACRLEPKKGLQMNIPMNTTWLLLTNLLPQTEPDRPSDLDLLQFDAICILKFMPVIQRVVLLLFRIPKNANSCQFLTKSEHPGLLVLPPKLRSVRSCLHLQQPSAGGTPTSPCMMSMTCAWWTWCLVTSCHEV